MGPIFVKTNGDNPNSPSPDWTKVIAGSQAGSFSRASGYGTDDFYMGYLGDYLGKVSEKELNCLNRSGGFREVFPKPSEWEDKLKAREVRLAEIQRFINFRKKDPQEEDSILKKADDLYKLLKFDTDGIRAEVQKK
ncbi:hypothetical protein N7471_010572 [Penicillium samsonianum]|uniref:uncharacterized protein n=1 Tax=Penicillium samsonianum TaxID=1882272 RepID=UPI0025488C44|nr:uncharacterized protein N7471_010572 [Penicillium samsonianum]KAJ6126079.1 hypothetical protein N7471_010572 [Penicillium samsonianum]